MKKNSYDNTTKILDCFPSKPKISYSRNGAQNECGIHATHEVKRDNGNADETSKSPHRYLSQSKCKIEDGILESKIENLNASSYTR